MPVHRDEALKLSAVQHSEVKVGGMLVGFISITLHGMGGVLGEGSIKSMAINQEDYQKQRNKK